MGPFRSESAIRADELSQQLERTRLDYGQAQQVQADLQQQLAASKEVQAVLEQRLQNLKEENERLHTDLAGVIMQSSGEKAAPAPRPEAGELAVSPELDRALAELDRKYEAIVYDSKKVVCRFDSARSFIGEGDRPRQETVSALRELASLLNSPVASNLHLAIVGHTSKRSNVVPPELVQQHPTDWHLAAHQAISFQQLLEEFGVAPTRVGVISYAGRHPLSKGDDDVAQRTNARIEIFFLPPEPTG